MGDLSKYKNLEYKHQEDLYNLESVSMVCYVIVFIRNSYLSSFVWAVFMALGRTQWQWFHCSCVVFFLHAFSKTGFNSSGIV